MRWSHVARLASQPLTPRLLASQASSARGRALSSSSASAPAYLVMGANGGIGRSLSEKLLQDGGRVALCCRDEVKMNALVEHLLGLFGAEAKERIMTVQVLLMMLSLATTP